MTYRCFLSLAIKALEIKKKFKLYTSEKEYAKAGNNNGEINKCLGTKFSESFDTILNAPKDVKPSFFNRFLVEDSVENFIFKSVIGFLGGIILTYIFFMFLVFSLNFTLKRATYICIGMSVILSLGLAFSVKIRCTVFLCIPQLFSKRGRQALLAYAFILALSGPAKNTLHNVEVMSESLACTQEQLKQTENDLLKFVQRPNAAAKRMLEKLLIKINSAVKDFKNFILELYKTCFDILETILQSQKWLYSITLLCHKKVGKPAHRCLNLLAETRENCENALPMPNWRRLCRIRPYGQEIICSTNAKSVCLRSDVPESLPVLKLQKQLDVFKHRAMNIFYVSIEAHQVYFQTNRTCTYHEEYQGMATEIRQKTDQFLQYFDFMSVIFGVFILVVFVKVIIYRHKFLTEDNYDNRYITTDFVDIDNTRAAFQMETVLPLVPRERLEYIKVTSVRLVPCERVRLLSSFVFLIFATFKIIIHMLTDSSLYWILSTVRWNERFLYMSTLKVKDQGLRNLWLSVEQKMFSFWGFTKNFEMKHVKEGLQRRRGLALRAIGLEEEPVRTVRVVGDGLVADLLRNVSRAVKKESALVRLDPTPCLPDPVPPDWNRYYQILALVLICWLLALFEPYGLRLRHSVMVTYHPDRARERAIWLYNRIISNRISFVKLSRRELRRKYKDVWLENTFRYKFMRKASSPRCLLCKTAISSVDGYVKCKTTKCAGLYCTACFACLKFCSICTDPAEYGDLSDLSEEKDSSEEECRKSPGKRQKLVKSKNKKGEISLKLRKTHIKLKEIKREGKMTEKSKPQSLIQPALLYRALKYCRSKMPSFRKLKALSDFESSDWEDSNGILEDSSDDKKLFKGEKKGGKHKEGSLDVDMLSLPGEDSKPKVRLFRKESPISPLPPLPKDNRIDFHVAKETPKPDFYFGICKKGDKSLDLYTYRKIRQEGFLPDSCRKSDSGVLVNDQILEKELKKEELFSQSPSTQFIVDPLELESKYSELKTESPRKLPFIDPVNVHEFDLGTDSDGDTNLCSCGSERMDPEKDPIATPMATYLSSSRTRICFKKSKPSESDSVKVCMRNIQSKSSSESDCQFYYRPFHSSKSLSPPKTKSSSLKKASGKLNLKPHKFASSYMIETDSSNDKFLTVKPPRRVCRKSKRVKQIQEEIEPPQKPLNRSRGGKSDFLKAKLLRFFKKNLTQRKSSAEDGSTDIDDDDDEDMSNTAIFLSEEEFRKISKEITRKKAKEQKQSKLLSSTPDLLLGLPSG